MDRQIVLLHGINLGAHKKVAMPELRRLLEGAGFGEVLTYLQSGNVVLTAESSSDSVAHECERQIATHFGFSVEVIVRTRLELAEVVRRNPLGGVATDPKRYQVSFLSAEPPPDRLAALQALAVEPERIVVDGREIYTWHPHGIGRSRLGTKLGGKGLGVTATARNWNTVTSLLAMADGR